MTALAVGVASAALVLTPAAANAQTQSVPLRPSQAQASEPPSSPPGDVARMRGLDKITAETRDFDVPLGMAVRFGSLTVVNHYCRKRPPEEQPETYVLVEVLDRTTDGRGVEGEPVRIFAGWMFASNPALNPLQHPVYDVWPLDCRIDNAPAPGTAEPN